MMQTPAQLVPGVVPSNSERLVYEVASRSGDEAHRVDLERRSGLGECDCMAFSKGGHKDCFHLAQARKFLSIQIAQTVMRQTLGIDSKQKRGQD